jgi:hypothetical protein
MPGRVRSLGCSPRSTPWSRPSSSSEPRGSSRATSLGPQAGEEPGLEEESSAFAATVEEPRKERTPRLDWAGLLKRTFALEVFACLRCGGRRRVLAYVKGAGGVRAIVEHLGLPTAGVSLTPARAPPQDTWC